MVVAATAPTAATEVTAAASIDVARWFFSFFHGDSSIPRRRDGKASEGRAARDDRRDHLGKIGHQSRPELQLRRNGMLGGFVPVAHHKDEATAGAIRSMRAKASQNASGVA